jgi:hypothetical protein
MNFTENQLRRELEHHSLWIEKQPGVVTTGIGLGQQHPLCIKVYGDEIDQDTKQKVEKRLKDLPVEFEPTPQGRAY